MPPVKAGSSAALCQQVYDQTVRHITDKLQKVFIDQEQESNFAKETGFREFAAGLQGSEQFNPQKETKVVERIQQQERVRSYMSKKKFGLDWQMQKMVTKNVYRERYDIPVDLMVRRADADIIAATKSSQTLDRVRQLD